MELTIGPVLFEWTRDDLRRFYDEVAAMEVNSVYLGEVVCNKKRGLSLKETEEVGRMLEGAGKKVVLSTLAVVSNEEELATVRDLCSLPFAVEANDMCVFNMINAKEREVSAGPHITTYNTDDIAFLNSVGVTRVTFPVELPGSAIKESLEGTDVTAEVFAHGKAPLAFSWRCYTLRHHGKTKDGCALDCARYPGGMEVRTIDDEPAFTINGTSVLSSQVTTLIGETEELQAIGVGALRISPSYEATGTVVDIFRKRLSGELTPCDALGALDKLSPGGLCNGWYSGRAGKLLIPGSAALEAANEATPG